MLYGYEVLSFFPSLLGLQESRPLTVAYRVIVFGLAFLVIYHNKVQIKRQFLLIYFFWFLYLIRLFYDTAITSRNIQSPLVEYWSFSIIILCSTVACATQYSKETILSARNWVFLFLIIVNIMGFYNNLMHPQIVPDDVLVRVDGNASLNSISFGRTSGVLFFICFTMLFEKTKIFTKIALILVMLFAVSNLFIAGSRGSLLQLIFVLIVFLYSYRKKIKLKYVIYFIGGILILINFFPQYFNVSELLIDRLKGSGFSSNQSDQLRAQFFNSAWNQFTNNPFFGDSIETIVGKTYPHNIILESLMAIGFVGGILIVIILLYATINSIKFLQNNSYNWIGAILLMDVISSFSSGSIVNYLLLWPLISLTMNNNLKNEEYENSYD